MLTPQFVLALAAKLVVDLFAGGGGASTGIEQGIGRHVDIAINHDADAIGMHEVNHPQTRHCRADIREVDPLSVTRGQAVGLLHASPDCTHHSQALGGQPRKHEIRSLAWVVHRWAGKTRPDVITLENVEQMLLWSPLIAKRDPATGRVITLEKVLDASGRMVHRVAEPGEQVPRSNQFLVPDAKRKGHNWEHFVQGLRAMGYEVQWRVICNADLGAHSTRTRLYMIARRDGLPIVWPEKTHAKKPIGKLKKHRPAADCIDWSIQGQSIFGRKKDLADATLRRIAYGMQKFVLESPDPFIVNMAHGGKVESTASPFSTIATEKGGCRALVAPTLMPLTHHGAQRANDMREPLATVAAGGEHHALVQYHLSQEHEAGALRCAAFLMRYHGSGGQWADLRDPMTTITTRDRLALVTVWLKGEPWVIVDICLRMLTPRELYNAQDFPANYVIDRTASGKRLTKTAQVRMVGNSVSPLPMRLLVAANYIPRLHQGHGPGGQVHGRRGEGLESEA